MSNPRILSIFVAFLENTNFNKEQFCAQMLQICANLHKSWNNTMSNDGLIIENMDLSQTNLSIQFFSLDHLSPKNQLRNAKETAFTIKTLADIWCSVVGF